LISAEIYPLLWREGIKGRGKLNLFTLTLPSPVKGEGVFYGK
jgi:hypothetical protein